MNDRMQSLGMRAVGALSLCALVVSALVVPPMSYAQAAQEVAPGCYYVTDRNIYPKPSTPARPAYMTPFTDQTFGQTYTRITGDAGVALPSSVGGVWPSLARHHYSSDWAWNADGSLLYLEMGGLMLDGETYAPIKRTSYPIVRWHPTDPKKMIYFKNNTIGYLNVETDVLTPVHTFTGYKSLQFTSHGVVAVEGGKVSIFGQKLDNSRVAFWYDMNTGQRGPDFDPNRYDLPNPYVYDILISPLGNYFTHINDPVITVRDLNGNILHSYDAIKHPDMSVDENGDEVIIGIRNRQPDPGSIVKIRLRDGFVTTLESDGYGVHVSTRNHKNPGWTVVSYDSSTSYPPLSGELALVSLNGELTRRLAHIFHSPVHRYHAETQPSISPDGSKIIFVTDWSGNGTEQIHAYVMELCGMGGEDEEPEPLLTLVYPNRVETTATAQVYKQTSLTGGIAGTKPEGAKGQVTTKGTVENASGTFVNVKFDGGPTGWVLRGYLALEGQGGNPDPDPDPEPEPTVTYTYPDRVETTATAQVRSTPSATGVLLAELASGKRGQVTTKPSTFANGQMWVNVKFDGGPTGWVVDTLLKKI